MPNSVLCYHATVSEHWVRKPARQTLTLVKCTQATQPCVMTPRCLSTGSENQQDKPCGVSALGQKTSKTNPDLRENKQQLMLCLATATYRSSQSSACLAL
ncbi:hypothetical protein ElyMa_003777300 [Elysia marginata]|uniref:Uncharacterized protein n=1 Tax=Elysia marginata TaxID=1093978 RepID=A0AAV4F9V4_9GAST|nr:hypothetical protein ElyMa_003777300 [Elysia marginata]